MKRDVKRVVTTSMAVALVLAIALLWAAHGRGGSRTGGTYDVTVEFVNGDDVCADVHEADVGGTKWFGQDVPPSALAPNRSYEGTLYVVDQGAGENGLVDPTRTGIARFTTGSTTL